MGDFIQLFLGVAEPALKIALAFGIGSYIIRKFLDMAMGRKFRL